MMNIIRKLFFLLLFVGVWCNGFGQDLMDGDTLREDGITYKVVLSYWAADSQEDEDDKNSISWLKRAGSLEVVAVAKGMKSIVIPPSVGRYKVEWLKDSLFAGRRLEKIWLPELYRIGNGCFAWSKIGSGGVVIKRCDEWGEGVFDGMEGDVVLDTKGKVGKESAFGKDMSKGPGGYVWVRNDNLGAHTKTGYYAYLMGAGKRAFEKIMLNAYGGDKSWTTMKWDEKELKQMKRSYDTMPSEAGNKGLNVRVQTMYGKRTARYCVTEKKKGKSFFYDDLEPLWDMKKGLLLKFKNADGTSAKYNLKGKKVK